MEILFPFFFALTLGFAHAFETDHLVAVGNLVTRRPHWWLAIKDGIFWGLGHTSTVFLIGGLIILGKVTFPDESVFHRLEAGVGGMLVMLGLWRMLKIRQLRSENHTHTLHDHSHTHKLAYGVGLVHGLAGSGGLVLLAMTKMPDSFKSMLFLLVFGVGSVGGMLVAAGIFSLPFSRKIIGDVRLQIGLAVLSSVLCIGFGSMIIYQNLTA
jgi:hypothetical protein